MSSGLLYVSFLWWRGKREERGLKERVRGKREREERGLNRRGRGGRERTEKEGEEGEERGMTEKGRERERED